MRNRLRGLILFGALLVLFVGLVDTLLTVRLPQGDEPALLYANQLRDDLQRTVVKAVESAKRSVMLLTYTLSDGQVIRALKAKAVEGVDVTVIVDAKASPQAKRQLGANVHTLRRSPPGLMHLKMLIIDEKLVWIGSANMTFDSLRIHGNLMVAMEHPQLAMHLLTYARALPQAGLSTPPPPILFALKEQQGELWLLPNSSGAAARLLALIASAQKTIRVAMFTWTRPDVTQAVIQAYQRGVDVEVVIDRRQGQGAGAETVHRLLQAGIPVALNQGDGLLHHKMMLVDASILVIGSANWTRSAFKNNDDCFLVLDPLTQSQRSRLEELWQMLLLEAEHRLDGKKTDAMLYPLGGGHGALSKSFPRARGMAQFDRVVWGVE